MGGDQCVQLFEFGALVVKDGRFVSEHSVRDLMD